MERFAEEKYVSVRTFKRSGEAVETPVWSIVVDGKLYFGTPAHTWKVKRIRNNAEVEVAPSDSRGRTSGEWVEGTATTLSAAEFVAHKKKLDAKYGLTARLLNLWAKVRRWDYIGVEVTAR